MLGKSSRLKGFASDIKRASVPFYSLICSSSASSVSNLKFICPLQHTRHCRSLARVLVLFSSYTFTIQANKPTAYLSSDYDIYLGIKNKCVYINSRQPYKLPNRRKTHRLTNGHQVARADGQPDERSDGYTGRFEQIRYPRVQL